MAEVNFTLFDKTLLKIDSIIEQTRNYGSMRKYLGMSGIGESCERKIFYTFRNAVKRFIKASGLKAIEDGFDQEAKMIERFKLLPNIKLKTHQENGKQIGFKDFDGLFAGHCDGQICGIEERPGTWHIWEHKSVNQTKFNKLKKLREEHGEKKALELWDYTYYCQGQAYMHYAGFDRHYLTVSSPGGREYISVRTELNENKVNAILEKAHRLIYSDYLPAKLSDKPEYYECKLCDCKDQCHGNADVEKACGTCEAFIIKKGVGMFCTKTNDRISNHVPCAEYELNHIFNNGFVVKESGKGKEEKQKFSWIEESK